MLTLLTGNAQECVFNCRNIIICNLGCADHDIVNVYFHINKIFIFCLLHDFFYLLISNRTPQLPFGCVCVVRASLYFVGNHGPPQFPVFFVLNNTFFFVLFEYLTSRTCWCFVSLTKNNFEIISTIKIIFPTRSFFHVLLFFQSLILFIILF